uniref:Uncharacterized protein n=1 Tax=Ciona savignyi TaxID=51511 RepID=H2Z8Q1_CIOSA
MHAHGTHDKQKCGNVTRCAEIRDGASCGNASYRNVTHGIWTERNPSLRSGYSPDSSGLSDVDKYEVSPYLFGPHPVYHVTDTACYVTDTSVRSVFGSSLISDPPAPLSRDKFILKSCKRSSTPCIGYSSSDAEQVARVSVSSLDGVLESVMVPTMFSDDSNSDHIWSDDVIYSTSTHQNEARHVTNSSNHVREGRTRCDL